VCAAQVAVKLKLRFNARAHADVSLWLFASHGSQGFKVSRPDEWPGLWLWLLFSSFHVVIS
jgi:hypothetical protein